jgi:hypothetical protein
MLESQFGSIHSDCCKTNANFNKAAATTIIIVCVYLRLRQYLPQLYSNHKKANTTSIFTITETAKSIIFIIFDFCLHQSSHFLHNVVLSVKVSLIFSRKCFIMLESQFGSIQSEWNRTFQKTRRLQLQRFAIYDSVRKLVWFG